MNAAVEVRLLLGPAGSGKTFRCLTEIRSELARDPSGPPLVLLAPRQATFQLERQLLLGGSVAGYTRLHIWSMQRLAEAVLEHTGTPLPPLLDEDGRVMTIRALLGSMRSELAVFHATARLPGFARQAAEVLAEFEEHGVTPERLQALANELEPRHRVRGKLLDLARLQDRYRNWLAERKVEDQSRLLTLAGRVLEAIDRPAVPWFGGLWLDGFAEMTPQELNLVAKVIPFCARARLAFCLRESGATDDWLSPWSLVNRTCHDLKTRLGRQPGLALATEMLPGPTVNGRFAASPELAHLERCWAAPQPWDAGADAPSPIRALRMIQCPTPEAEAEMAARILLRFVREEGGRFREAAVLVRTLDGYDAVFRRVFARYEIPVFIDRRQGVTHHPLSELTRSALRLAALGWQTEDWMSVLKTGLVGEEDQAIDHFENAALANGWNGPAWLQPFPRHGDEEVPPALEALRQRLVTPFAEFTRELMSDDGQPTGAGLVGALRSLWRRLGVEATLQAWTDAAVRDAVPTGGPGDTVHGTVWRDLDACLENLARAFADVPMAVREWLPILEAGLANLTVGVIPPVLDHVLLGAVDRSRNPDLKLVILPGWNEGVFPAPIPPGTLLTDADRDALADRGLPLGPDRRRRIGRERYYAYIAATRARERLVVTFAERDADDRAVGPSPFVTHLRRLFPTLVLERGGDRPTGIALEHRCEAIVPWLRDRLRAGPGMAGAAEVTGRDPGPIGAEWNDLPAPLDLAAGVPSALADRLHGGGRLRSSVSRLERFAACPFQFFVHSGLRAGERERFEVDVRQTGSFQHEVLARFHKEVARRGLRWRDLSIADARNLVAAVAADLSTEFGHGLFLAEARRRFEVRAMTMSLQDLVEALVGWMHERYAFDPVAVECGFGGTDATLSAWEVELGDGRKLVLHGRIDRIDAASRPEAPGMYVIVIDYKSSPRLLDATRMEHGLELQLPAYLAALRARAAELPWLAGTPIEPAGMFFVPLRRSDDSLRHRAGGRRPTKPYQHRGRFSESILPLLDGCVAGAEPSGQFSYRAGGKGGGRASDPLPAVEFQQLLDHVERKLSDLGQQIFAGRAEVSPYRRNASDTACLQCLYASVCRFDPWLHEYRRLTAPRSPSPGETTEPAG